MRLGPLLVALVLLLAPIAGCLGGDEDESRSASTEADGAEAETSSAQAASTESGASSEADRRPNWTHGDWWTYDVSFDLGFAELLSGETTLVLHDTQDTYDVAAADRNAAIVDQHFDTFFVGSLDEQLNPLEKAQMFSFPLEDGANWTTEFDTPTGAAEIELTAEATTVELPTGSESGFEITGENEEEGVEVRYTYAPSVQWITSFSLTAPDFEGEQREVLSMELVEHGAAYEGTFVVLDMEELYFEEMLGVPLNEDDVTSRVAQVSVGEEFTFAQRVIVLAGFDVVGPTSGHAQVDLVTPDAERQTYQQTGQGQLVEIMVDEPPIAGDWEIVYENVGTNVALVGFFGFHEEVVEFTPEDHAHHE